MVKKLFNKILHIDKSIVKLIKKVLTFSFIICIISTLILTIYIQNPISHTTYIIGLKLFKCGLLYAVGAIICGISTDIIKNGT